MKNYILLFSILSIFSFSNNTVFAQTGPQNFTVTTDDLSQYPCLSSLSLEFDQMLIPLSNFTNGQSFTVNDMNSIALHDPTRFVTGSMPFTYTQGSGGLVVGTWTACFQECCDGEYLDICLSFTVTRGGHNSLNISVTSYGDCF